MKLYSRLKISLICAVAVCQMAVCQNKQATVDNFAARSQLRHAAVGICVMDIDSSKVVAEHNMNQAMTTASTMKTITSASALNLLGADYRFETSLFIEGEVKDGVLNGNVVIKGGCDPTLGSRYFELGQDVTYSFARAIAAMGINTINGKVKVDSSKLGTLPVSNKWLIEDLGWTYGTGSHALNFADNCVTLSFDRKGEKAENFKIRPEVKGLEVHYDVKLANNDRNEPYTITSYLPRPTLAIYGEVKRQKKPYVSRVSNPAPEALFADSVSGQLRSLGVSVGEAEIADSVLTPRVLVMRHESPRLVDIVESLLDHSNNMFSESLIQAISMCNGGKASPERGIKEVYKLWKSKGLDTAPLWMRDGSGLARTDAATPLFMCQFLAAALADSVNTRVKLPKVMNHIGESTTIGKSIPRSALKGKIAVKSGSMSGVQCYVGYFPADNPRYTWAVMVNHFLGNRSDLKQAMDDMLLNLFIGDLPSEEPEQENTDGEAAAKSATTEAPADGDAAAEMF